MLRWPRRQRPSPAVEGTIEFVLCNNADCFPRILCFFPLAIGLIAGFSFSFNTAISGSPVAIITFAAIGFLVSSCALLYCAAGAPYFRRRGCCVGCRELLVQAAAMLLRCRAPFSPEGRGAAAALESAPPLQSAAAREDVHRTEVAGPPL